MKYFDGHGKDVTTYITKLEATLTRVEELPAANEKLNKRSAPVRKTSS